MIDNIQCLDLFFYQEITKLTILFTSKNINVIINTLGDIKWKLKK